MVIMTALLILLITGYLFYKIITSPIKTFRLIVKGGFIFVLGCIVWLVLICLLIYSL